MWCQTSLLTQFYVTGLFLYLWKHQKTFGLGSFIFYMRKISEKLTFLTLWTFGKFCVLTKWTISFLIFLGGYKKGPLTWNRLTISALSQVHAHSVKLLSSVAFWQKQVFLYFILQQLCWKSLRWSIQVGGYLITSLIFTTTSSWKKWFSAAYLPCLLVIWSLRSCRRICLLILNESK